MNRIVELTLGFWAGAGGASLFLAGLLGFLWCMGRWALVERQKPVDLLRCRKDPFLRWMLLHRRSSKSLPVSLILMSVAGVMRWFATDLELCEGAAARGPEFLIAHAGAIMAAVVLLFLWDRAPKYVKQGEGRADAQFRDVPEEWGAHLRQSGKRVASGLPTAEILGFRSPARLARRLLEARRFGGDLTLISLRWDILSRHVFVVGPQGSGKTSTIYGHLMLSASCPWVYQDSKAELPYKEQFPGLPVWGLDIRGHETRSAVWNPLEEIRSPEDFDLIVDYLFPVNPHDANAWVRDMARVIFGAILRAKRWQSIQEIAASLKRTRLEPFLQLLDPIYQDTMKEPKSQVPILQDLVVTLSRWETERVRTITEGRSTVRLDDFISKGGYVMNAEGSDSLKVPVQLFWGMLLGRLRNRPEGASAILLLLDEFGDCGRIPNVQRALVLLRSKGVALVAGIQNLGLLQDVYYRDWKAVIEGFGTRIFLARNLEDDLRQQLSLKIGKFTRRIPPAGKQARETEREADLLPLDAWGAWSEARAAIGRLHGFTYWLPEPLTVTASPLGPRKADGDPWGTSEMEALASADSAVADLLAIGPELQLPWPLPPGSTSSPSRPPAAWEASTPDTEDWL